MAARTADSWALDNAMQRVLIPLTAHSTTNEQLTFTCGRSKRMSIEHINRETSKITPMHTRIRTMLASLWHPLAAGAEGRVWSRMKWLDYIAFAWLIGGGWHRHGEHAEHIICVWRMESSFGTCCMQLPGQPADQHRSAFSLFPHRHMLLARHSCYVSILLAFCVHCVDGSHWSSEHWSKVLSTDM